MGLGLQTEKEMFDLGDSIPVTLKLDLPQVAEAASLSVMLSGTDAEETRSSVMFCSPTIKKNVKIIFEIKVLMDIKKNCRKMSARGPILMILPSERRMELTSTKCPMTLEAL